MKHHSGFTLLENMVGMLVFLVSVVLFVPAFLQGLILGNVLWERRQAMKVIEQTLEEACNAASTSANFASLQAVSRPAVPFPTELANPVRRIACMEDSIAAPPAASLSCTGTELIPQDCTTSATVTVKRLDVRVCWNSKGRTIQETSAPYVISRTGVCGAGT